MPSSRKRSDPNAEPSPVAAGPRRGAVTEFWFNRRALPRHAMVRRSGILHIGAEREPCVIVNISAGGLMARTYRAQLAGEAVRVELAPGETIAGEVLWAQDWTVGIAFDGLIDVEAVLARAWVGEHCLDRRRSPRVAVDCPASLRINARFHYGRIAELSSGGARFRGSARVKKTGPALLNLPDLPPMRADVAWLGANECGLVFEEPIPEEALRRWLASRGRPSG